MRALALGTQNLFALGAHQHAIGGVFEVHAIDAVLVLAGGQQGGFVGEVAQVGAGHADHFAGDGFQIDIVGQGLVAGVYLEDFHPAMPGGAVHGHVAIEAAGP